MKRYTLNDLNSATTKRVYKTILANHKLSDTSDLRRSYNTAISNLHLRANKEALLKVEGELIEIVKGY